MCECCRSFSVVDGVYLCRRFDLSVCYGSICDDFQFNKDWNRKEKETTGPVLREERPPGDGWEPPEDWRQDHL